MPNQASTSADPQLGQRARRRTPLSAHGEPSVWLMGVALLMCLLLIVGLIGIIVVRGARTFWPNEIQTITLRSGETFLGQLTTPLRQPRDHGLHQALRRRGPG